MENKKLVYFCTTSEVDSGGTMHFVSIDFQELMAMVSENLKEKLSFGRVSMVFENKFMTAPEIQEMLRKKMDQICKK